MQVATWQDQAALIQQTLYSCLYLTDSSLYNDSPDLQAFIHGLLYVANLFYANAIMTMVLREEDVNFPPTTDNFSFKEHPVLKDLTTEQILVQLEQAKTPQLAPYLDLVASLVQTTAWAMDPKSLDFLKAASKPAGGGKKNRKKKQDAGAAKAPIEEQAVEKM